MRELQSPHRHSHHCADVIVGPRALAEPHQNDNGLRRHYLRARNDSDRCEKAT
jgi:hypothetical protein